MRRKEKRWAYIHRQERIRLRKLRLITERRKQKKKMIRNRRTMKANEWLDKHRDFLNAPKDFRLLKNPEECASFFQELLSKEKSYPLTDKWCEIQLNLEWVEHVDFASTLLLSAVCEDLSHHKCNVKGNSPRRKECHKYFKDSGFYNSLYDSDGHIIKKMGNASKMVFETGENGLNENNIRAFINLLSKVISHFHLDEGINHRPHVTMLKEICGNSVEWGGIQRKNWTIGAKFEDNKVIFVALDLGQGILKSLERRPKQFMDDLFKNRTAAEVLRRVFYEYYGSKSRDINRNCGLPYIRKCNESNIIRDLKVVTNNVCLAFSDESETILFERGAFSGTLYSWVVDANCLTSSLN
jgi:hypothetical protein